MQRRDLFRLLPPTWLAFQSSLAMAMDQEETYWRLVAQQFPLEPGLLYFNAANVCPSSRLVLDRHLQFLRDFHANPSFQNRDKYAPMQERVRLKAAALLNAEPDEIAITRNTSEGSNTIATGLELNAGDEVIVTDHNHPSNLESWRLRARRRGFTVKTVELPAPAPSSAALLQSLEGAITPRTKVIAVTHVTSTVGLRYPAAEVGKVARARNIWYHLDGAQSFGAIAVDLKAIGCDSYATSMHKWPMGPLESGLLFVRRERQASVWPSIVTAGWRDDLKGARKFEVMGQRDDPRVASIEAALDFLMMIGPARYEARLMTLTTALKKELGALPGAKLRTNLDPTLAAGVVKVDFPDRDVAKLYAELWEKHRLALSLTANGASRGLRFSPHVYNSLDDVSRAVAAVRRVIS
ncbi:MAG: aminotransferase class V-fold PLP-dependent enzyme [Bryobacteraceae bacterium]|nr:aminotransferase class V-fold PLP-dependent enzyme [Bryobacteraceae bacterium]